MKSLFIKYFREILITIFGIVIVYFLYKIYFTSTDNSKLIKYKLEVLDKEIEQLYGQRKSIDSSINIYNENIKKIDSSIYNIKIEKTIINQTFKTKENEIKKADAKTVDSLLRLRYRY